MTYLLTGDRARWEVLWVKRRKGKNVIICHEFENDFSGALALYLKVKGKRPLVTLRSCNVGFPPPEKYRPHTVDQKKVVGHKVVKRNGRKKRVRIVRTEEVDVVPMQELNLKGIWWCPYCREMRKFQHYDGFDTSSMNVLRVKKDMFVPAPGMYCPICWINQNDSHVRRWNPQAVLMEFRINTRRRRGSGRNRTTRSRTRRRS